jgi:hypothetical protein
MEKLTVQEMTLLSLIDKSTVIDSNWFPYLKGSKKGLETLKAMKKLSDLSSYQLILEKHEGWKITDFINYYLL